MSYPDLQFDPLVIPVDGFHLEIDAHRTDKGWCEGVISVAEQKGGFAHTAISDDEDLKHIVKVLVWSLLLPVGRCCWGHLWREKKKKKKFNQMTSLTSAWGPWVFLLGLIHQYNNITADQALTALHSSLWHKFMNLTAFQTWKTWITCAGE